MTAYGNLKLPYMGKPIILASVTEEYEYAIVTPYGLAGIPTGFQYALINGVVEVIARGSSCCGIYSNSFYRNVGNMAYYRTYMDGYCCSDINMECGKKRN